MLSVLICFQHTTTINSNFPSTAKAQPPKRVYPLYLWPRSKVWMRALKASIQTAATKVTNIGGRLSSGASFCLRQIPIEQNRCAMACQGCGAVLFLLKKQWNYFS